MDIQSFIQSGLLESYALGQCTPEERVLVEEMLSKYQEARTELEGIEQALEKYANAQTVPPPPGLKERIMEEIDRIGMPSTLTVDKTMYRVYQAAVAAVFLLLGTTGYLWFQKTQSDTNQENLQKQVAQLQQELSASLTRNASCREIVDFIRKPETKAFKMDNKKDAPAFVFHNTTTSNCTALLDVAALPTQLTGKYLQFWALVDGKPVSMGMIQMDAESGFQAFPCVENAAGFAVSVEDKKDGNPIPTRVLMAGTQG